MECKLWFTIIVTYPVFGKLMSSLTCCTKVSEDNKQPILALSKYEYNKTANKTMQSFLFDLDKKRGTNSPKLYWCLNNVEI